ncbi:MAG: hypothetical protein AAF530_17285 [Pseudomonadota bacterium]
MNGRRDCGLKAAQRTKGLKHIRTESYTLHATGKQQHIILSALKEWAYAAAYDT